MSEDTFSLDGFAGMARLFPLPNLVMFPHVVQPLHIFESRYVEMLEDALAGDHLIATALLMPGWEGEYDGRPPVDPIVCLGRVISHSPTKELGAEIPFRGQPARRRGVPTPGGSDQRRDKGTATLQQRGLYTFIACYPAKSGPVGFYWRATAS